MREDGWIKVHRKIFNKKWSMTKIGCWIWLIAKAKFQPPDRGILQTTLKELVDEWNVSKSTVYRWLKEWDVSLSFLGPKRGQGSIKVIRISIKNYHKYQIVNNGIKNDRDVTGKIPGRDREDTGKLCSKIDEKTDSSKTLRKKESKNVRKELSKLPEALALRRQFSDYFVAAYKDCHGEEYAWEGAKDGKHLTTLMKRAKNDLDLFKRKVDTFFGHQLSWVEGGRTLGLLVNQWNKITVKKAKERVDWDKVVNYGE